MILNSYDHFSNLFVTYYYGSYIHLDDKWKGYNQNCVYSKFYYITDGECEIKIGDTAYQGIPGRLFYIPAGLKHSFYHVNENFITKYWAHFKLEAGGESLDKKYELPIYVDVREAKEIVECFQMILEPCNSLSSELKRNAKLLELFSIYLSRCEESGKITPASEDNNFHQVLLYIKNNLNRKPTIQELSDVLHVHPNYFIRMFKSRTGMSPGKYINDLRCEIAKSLLENTTTPINKIMIEVGFEENSAFSHFFKVNTGYSPNEFRMMFGH